jgi:glycosyltransferase involved in cell wall biosynthesis
MTDQPLKILVDGRVFSTVAHDRGMGLYVRHILSLLACSGHKVSVLLFRNCYLRRDDPVFSRYSIRFVDRDPEVFEDDATERSRACHQFTALLSELIDIDGYAAYVDATPFVGPERLDIFSCSVIAICYDLIPLRHPDFYLCAEPLRATYYNGLARLSKADSVVCISQTTRDEVARYLGIPESRLTVIYPVLGDHYRDPSEIQPPTTADQPYAFSILGSHKSKNPEGSLALYGELLHIGGFTIRVNAPTRDQMNQIKTGMKVPRDVRITCDLAEAEKRSLQANALFVLHMSLEEGFGIPFLEALFLGRKIVALDIPMNREVTSQASASHDAAVFFIPPGTTQIDRQAFQAFLQEIPNVEFFRGIRESFVQHWEDSPNLLDAAIKGAKQQYGTWLSGIRVKMFSSLPGSACGVADYSAAYIRSCTGNVMLFCSSGDQVNISFLPNIRLASYLDFPRFTSRFPSVKGWFNFAFSAELFPGIDLMRRYARHSDVVLVHDRRYVDGLRAFLTGEGRIEEHMSGFATGGAEEMKSEVSTDCVFDPTSNRRNRLTQFEGPLSSNWLTRIPARFISHLSSAILQEMQEMEQEVPGSVVNDLSDMEDRLEFVPGGIDDRSGPGVARAARRLRTVRGLQQDDLLFGHFGTILDHPKRLWDAVTAFVRYASCLVDAAVNNRRLYFVLAGKIVDAELFHRIKALFQCFGLSTRLIHSNPALEPDFDAEIAACDAIFCFRLQNRGQLSHVFMRALSLGTPVLVNRRSGYGFDPRVTIDDDRFDADIERVLTLLTDRSAHHDISGRARREYEFVHRGDKSLHEILNGGAA